jgi:hypothetical protein
VAVVLSDQHFAGNVPAKDGYECVRVMRVEDASLRELVDELLRVCKRWMLVPGSVIMLGSLTQLAKDGTAFYAGIWKQMRTLLKRELGDVTVVPLLPLVSVDVPVPHMVRCLIEYLDWYDDLQDPEAAIMRKVRREYVREFLCEEEDGVAWADGTQIHHMPISLLGEGTTRYVSRDYGAIPQVLKAVDEHTEALWIGKITAFLNSVMRMSLTTTVMSGRTLAAIRADEEEEDNLRFKVIGASNGTRSTNSLCRKGFDARKVGQAGWSLSVEKDVEDAVSELGGGGMRQQVIVFHCMDNGSFLSLNRTGGSSMPRKIDRKYHIPGKLVVATGFVLEQMLEQMLKIVSAAKPAAAVIIMPMPRFLDVCCEEHNQGRTQEKQEEDREKLLRMVWGMKREAQQMLNKAHMRNVILVSPMEVLDVKSSVSGVRKAMPDGVHLSEAAHDKVMDSVVQGVEEFLVSKKKGPTVHSERDGKRSRFSSAGEGTSRGPQGGWRGGRGGWMGGSGRGRAHTYY